jgi:hypothetical protein
MMSKTRHSVSDAICILKPSSYPCWFFSAHIHSTRYFPEIRQDALPLLVLRVADMTTSSHSGSHRRLIFRNGLEMTTSANCLGSPGSSKQVILLTRVIGGNFMVWPNALHQARRTPEQR